MQQLVAPYERFTGRGHPGTDCDPVDVDLVGTVARVGSGSNPCSTVTTACRLDDERALDRKLVAAPNVDQLVGHAHCALTVAVGSRT